jgi:DNA-directed RNA polymerase specialized sigma24 family protein
MRKNWFLTQGTFDHMLTWLGPSPEEAGRKYEDIRRRLIKIFTCRGSHNPEDLADETINRVAKRIEEIVGTYSGDPALYFYGVANKVHLESLRNRAPAPPAPPAPSQEIEQEFECLEHCMGKLDRSSRELVLQYYREEKRAKIDHRRMLAEQLGIALNALRIRAHRIRAALRECVSDCLTQHAG